MPGQESFDSYAGAGIRTAVDLINVLATERAHGRDAKRDDPLEAVRPIFTGDPTWPPIRQEDLPGLAELATRLRYVLDRLTTNDLDGAAAEVNALLAEHPAPPHLSKDDGRWRLHRHPRTAALVPMATAISGEAIARLLSSEETDRLGVCGAQACDRVFFDTSKNGSRRFCSTACQNRTKAAAYRRRHAAEV